MASTSLLDGHQLLDGSNPEVARMRQIMDSSSAEQHADHGDGWSRCWDEGVTPWDLGQPTPAVVELVRSGTLPSGDGTTVLVPGCGAGYDVVALSGPGRFVFGLDICETAIHKAKQSLSSSSTGGNFTFVAADFFTWEPPEKLDLIFDYTFFCALHPSLRRGWASRMAQLLKPEGELITLMYLVQGQEAGPPFNTEMLDYEEVLNPLGFVITCIQDNKVAVEQRKGMEKIARWKRTATN